MGGTAHHKASAYKGQHSVTDVDVSMPSVDFENATSVFQRQKIILMGASDFVSVNSFTYSVVCLKTGPQPLPKRVLRSAI